MQWCQKFVGCCDARCTCLVLWNAESALSVNHNGQDISSHQHTGFVGRCRLTAGWCEAFSKHPPIHSQPGEEGREQVGQECHAASHQQCPDRMVETLATVD